LFVDLSAISDFEIAVESVAVGVKSDFGKVELKVVVVAGL